MHIGILQAGHVPDPLQSELGDFDAMFTRLLDGRGFTFSSYDIEGMVFPESPGACDGWLITGSKHGAYEGHPFIPPLEVFIRDCVAADRPLVGICFGHQIIAQALGGRVVKSDAGWGLGKQVYRTVDGAMRLNAWHQDQVVALPPEARVLGGTDHCPNGILAIGRSAWTVQAHPEFDDALIARYAAHRRGTGTYPDDRMDEAAAQAAQAEGTDAAAMAGAITAFLKDRSIHAAL